jgi:predicted acyltransferase (DUF342 family)
MVFDKRTLVIPSETEIDMETNIITISGDVIIADRTIVDYTITTDGRVFIGEHVKLKGDIIAEDDVFIDRFSEVAGKIDGSNDVLLGEGVKIQGKVTVGKDLDVGDNVKLENGFDAKGWINIRNPIPYIIYLFIYLFELLKRGESKEVDKILTELEQQSTEDILVSEIFFFVPRNSVMTLEQIKIKGNCRIGENCKLKNNLEVSGTIKIGNESEFEGNIESKTKVSLGEECNIVGDINSPSVELYQNTVVEGVIHTTQGTRILMPESAEKQKMDAKLKRFEKGMDDLDEIL